MSTPEMYTRRQLNTMYRSVSLKDPVFRLLRKYFSAASNLYGVIPLRKLYEIIETQNPGAVSRSDFIAFSQIAKHEREGYFILSEGDLFQSGRYTPFLDYEIIDTTLLEIDIFHYIFLKKLQYGKPYYIPDKKHFLAYADPFHCDASAEAEALRTFLTNRLHLDKTLEKEVYDILFFGSKCVTVQTILEKMENLGVKIVDKADRTQFQSLYEAFCYQCRMQSHRGHTPCEISAMNIPADPCIEEFMQATMEEAVQTKTEKVGRNSPCPCGSGKKYKHCCRK